LPPPAFSALEGLRIAILLDVDICPVDPAVSTALLELGRWLSARGAAVSTVAPPFDPCEHDALFAGLIKGVVAARMDAATYNMRLKEAAGLSASDSGPAATSLRDFTQSHWLWASRNEARYRLRERWHHFFEDHDLLLLPGTPTPAFAIDESEPQGSRLMTIDGKSVAYTAQGFWQGMATVSYLPATIAPIAMTESGLPISVQVVGPYLQDMTTIAFAGEIERDYFRFTPPADFAVS
jgi:amidase